MNNEYMTIIQESTFSHRVSSIFISNSPHNVGPLHLQSHVASPAEVNGNVYCD